MFERLRKNKSILRMVDSKNFTLRLIVFLVSCFMVALNFNFFFAPNNLVVGGMSGLAIVARETFGISTTLFLYISMVVLMMLAFIFLGKKHAVSTLFGAIVFTVMVSITEPLVQYIHISFKSDLVTLLVSAVVYGVGCGVIYRSGFNTGGADVICAIINKYFKISMGRCCSIVNFIIIGLGYIVFGGTHTIYAILILFIANALIDVVMLGINDSKLCFIKTKKAEEIEKILMDELNMGVTEMVGRGGIFRRTIPTLLVIVPFDMYYGFKHIIIDNDPEAVILTHDCYAVTGGYKKHIIPF